MTKHTQERRQAMAGLALVATLAACALPALAQTPAPKPASTPAASNAQKAQEARDLTQAAFAHPAGARAPAPTKPAAQIAAEAAEAKAAAPVEPKPEWFSDDGVRIGGKGLQFKSPF